MTVTTDAPRTFTFDRNYDNVEQVRQYYPAYAAVRAELDAAGQYPYNDRFIGRIPGIEGPSQDTAIYLLQTMHDLDALAARVKAFIAAGGRRIDSLAPGEVVRGTVAHVGFYVGGTGWTEYPSARLICAPNGQLAVLPKGKRTRGDLLGGSGYVLVQPA